MSTELKNLNVHYREAFQVEGLTHDERALVRDEWAEEYIAMMSGDEPSHEHRLTLNDGLIAEALELLGNTRIIKRGEPRVLLEAIAPSMIWSASFRILGAEAEELQNNHRRQYDTMEWKSGEGGIYHEDPQMAAFKRRRREAKLDIARAELAYAVNIARKGEIPAPESVMRAFIGKGGSTYEPLTPLKKVRQRAKLLGISYDKALERAEKALKRVSRKMDTKVVTTNESGLLKLLERDMALPDRGLIGIYTDLDGPLSFDTGYREPRGVVGALERLTKICDKAATALFRDLINASRGDAVRIEESINRLNTVIDKLDGFIYAAFAEGDNAVREEYDELSGHLQFSPR